MATFRDAVQAWCDATGQTLADGTTRLVMGLAADVITATPVDTGTARSNWLATIDAPATGTTEATSEAAAIAATQPANDKAPGAVWYLTNNLPYIRRLEYDAWSAKNPEGMVEPAMRRIKANLKTYYAKRNG